MGLLNPIQSSVDRIVDEGVKIELRIDPRQLFAIGLTVVLAGMVLVITARLTKAIIK